MTLLAFDTCFGAVSVALRYRGSNGDWIVREAFEARQTGHAERLMPLITEVMTGAGFTFDRVDRFAVTIGPGSFTGVRVGVAAARAFALAAGRPVVGVSSLEVIAARARQILGERSRDRPLLVAIDARRGGLYCLLDVAGPVDAEPAPQLLTIGEAVALAQARAALVVGSGGPLMAEHARSPGHTIDTELASIEPHARHLALLAAHRSPAAHLAPLYLRSPDVRPQPDPIARQP